MRYHNAYKEIFTHFRLT